MFKQSLRGIVTRDACTFIPRSILDCKYDADIGCIFRGLVVVSALILITSHDGAPSEMYIFVQILNAV